eukprot:gene18021-biopygen11982
MLRRCIFHTLPWSDAMLRKKLEVPEHHALVWLGPRRGRGRSRDQGREAEGEVEDEDEAGPRPSRRG